MSYFKYFPQITYQFDGTNTQKLCTNIIVSTQIKDLLNDRSNKLYVDYLIKDGEKPEDIANRVYGRSDYHWIILLSNQIINPYFDWPLSTEALNLQIDKLYSGGAIFFDCVWNNIKFYKKDTSDFLPVSESYFIEGETISQNNKQATILQWDASLRKLIISNDAQDYNFNTTDKIYSLNPDASFHVYAKRVVLDNREAPHHFIDDFQNILDPYAVVNSTEYPDGKIYSRSNIFKNSGYTTLDSVTNDFPLNKYISGEFENYAVTNRQYEYDNNDRKRNIKILRVEYVDRIVNQLSKIFK